MSEPVSRRSAFAEKSAEEISRSYLGWFRRLRVCCAAAAVIVGTVAIAGLLVLDCLVLYLLGLVVLVGIGVWFRLRVGREFKTLVAIINTDCDAEKWRGGTGAYSFTNCTAASVDGHWSVYTVGAEAIS